MLLTAFIKHSVYWIQSAALPHATAPNRLLRIHRRFGETCYLHLKSSEERWNLATKQYGGTAVIASNTTTDIRTLFVGARVQCAYTQRVQSVGILLHPLNHFKPRNSSGVNCDLWCRIMDPNKSNGNAFKMRHRQW